MHTSGCDKMELLHFIMGLIGLVKNIQMIDEMIHQMNAQFIINLWSGGLANTNFIVFCRVSIVATIEVVLLQFGSFWTNFSSLGT